MTTERSETFNIQLNTTINDIHLYVDKIQVLIYTEENGEENLSSQVYIDTDAYTLRESFLSNFIFELVTLIGYGSTFDIKDCKQFLDKYDITSLGMCEDDCQSQKLIGIYGIKKHEQS